MSRDLLWRRVKEVLDFPNATEDSKLLDVLEDSLSVFEAVMAIEDEFDINIQINPSSLVTFGDLLNILEKNLKCSNEN